MICLGGWLPAFGQCGPPEALDALHANAIRATVTSGGDAFFSGRDPGFQITDEPDLPHTIFAEGLWLSAQHPSGSLRVAAQTYGRAAGRSDYAPGPIPVAGVAPDSQVCRNWDRLWSVTALDIMGHRSDFADNNEIDEPIEAIFRWPGQGNPYFEELNGFPLPEGDRGFAPFTDTDGDGIYDPSQGDYPSVPQTEAVPAQIVWSVFNDLALPHEESGGMPLGVEVQRTYWALNCSDNPQLNHTIFANYRLVNRSLMDLSNVKMGLWSDPDLGCYLDDNIGSSPERNTFFTYNVDNTDGQPGADCPGQVPTFGDNPPVQAVTFLNAPLDYYMYYLNAADNVPLGMTNPDNALEFDHLLSGRFRDGSPLTLGGDGYGENGQPTSHVFPGDPVDPLAWSIRSEDLPPGDRRNIGTTLVGPLPPGASFELEVGYTYLREEGADFLGNVSAMYEAVDQLQSWHNTGYEGVCSPLSACETDCVWPGDANADGIANYQDILYIGMQLGQNGPSREGFINWAPYDAESWAGAQPNGSNPKHTDTDGNGGVTPKDFETLGLNYGETRSPQSEQELYTPGPELTFRTVLEPDYFSEVQEGSSALFQIELMEEDLALIGLSFALEYDPRYFAGMSVQSPQAQLIPAPADRINYFRHNADRHQLEFGRFELTPDVIGGFIARGFIHALESFEEGAPSDTTYLRFKNVVGLLPDSSLIELGGQTVTAVFPDMPIVVQTESVEAPSPVRLFPNPTTGEVSLKFPGQRVERLAVFDPTGRRVRQLEGPFFDQHQLNLEEQPPGLYWLRIEMAGRLLARKLMVY